MPQTYSPKSFSPMARNFSVSENSWWHSDSFKTIPRHATILSILATHQSSGNSAKNSTESYQLSRVIKYHKMLYHTCQHIVCLYISFLSATFSFRFSQQHHSLSMIKNNPPRATHSCYNLSRSSIRSGPSCKCTGLHSLWFTPHMTTWAHAA